MVVDVSDHADTQGFVAVVRVRLGLSATVSVSAPPPASGRRMYRQP